MQKKGAAPWFKEPQVAPDCVGRAGRKRPRPPADRSLKLLDCLCQQHPQESYHDAQVEQ
jgi:hypothetical protein